MMGQKYRMNDDSDSTGWGSVKQNEQLDQLIGDPVICKQLVIKSLIARNSFKKYKTYFKNLKSSSSPQIT